MSHRPLLRARLEGALPSTAAALASALTCASSALLFAAPAQAQSTARPPEECGMTDATARFGGLEVGSVVTLQRHRAVSGDANWDPGMAHFLGRSARITRFASVDEAGCPGVRVDVDGGLWFWRARDLGIGTGPQPRPARDAASAPSGAPFPQMCHQDEARPDYGAAVPGAEVVLGRHRAVDGDDNWAAEMEAFVGRRARVVDAGGLDGAGCPGVRVDVDSQQWFWRVRDLRSPSSPGPAPDAPPPVVATGVSADHGRPAAVLAPPTGPAATDGLFGPTASATIPQQCGMTDANVAWGPLTVGGTVTLGQHRAVDGEANWSDDMAPFVGRAARITELAGVDEQGCAVVHVDADGGQWFWRARDLAIP